jgi:two-component system chemotaxis sensor kinase CheA
MIKDSDKYKDIFLSEAKELIETMNKALIGLEKEPTEIKLVIDIFRCVHTLKGMADTMDCQNTVQLCHAMEDVLEAMKKKKVKLNKSVDILFECFDTLEITLKRLKENNSELDTTALVEKLAATEETETETTKSTETSLDSAVAADTKVTSIEVKVEKLDLLMNLSEELLITKMRLDRIKDDLQDSELTAVTDILGRLIAEMQYNVMQARMVPVGFVFNRFPRMVRDLAKHQGKEVTLEMEGTDIELDRAVIDEIGESLIHLLRNAIDHGIERPEERKKSGKPHQGRVKLTASRTKNSAVIEVRDDGAGINFEEIKDTAKRRGILSPEASEKDVMNLIFSSLSTTKQVTAVSGRGFGLNIVKNKIESLGGTVDVESTQKKGTRFLIEVPLTLAVIKTLFVEVAGKLYAIPLASVERLLTVNRKDIKGMLQFEAIVLDEEDIPLTRLDLLFGEPSLELERQPIAIIRRGDERLGIAVDVFLDTHEIVIKPLNRLISESKYFAGTTIIGSGEVVLILDVANLMLSSKQELEVHNSELRTMN